MEKRRASLFLLLLLAGCAHAPPDFAFGVLGDTPYTEGEALRLDRMIEDMNRERLAFVVHVGDIGGNACTDASLEARQRQFARLRHPFVLIPGDNEWVDCPQPLARLDAWRKLFCAPALPVEKQPGEFCEHMRWVAAGQVFVTLNVQGSNNNVRNRAEHARRMRAVEGWIADSARLAADNGLGLVLMMQGDPFVVLPRDGFVALRARLEELGTRRPGRVVLVHGDSHTYHDDEPIPGVHRLEVWGSPVVSWIRGEIGADGVAFSAPRYR